MATFTFERPFVIKDKVSVQKLTEILNENEPVVPLQKPVFSGEERERSERLLEQYYYR